VLFTDVTQWQFLYKQAWQVSKTCQVFLGMNTMKTWHNTPDSYGLVNVFLHWSIALLFILLIILGLSMTNMVDGDDKWFLYSLHKSLGFTVLGLIIVRIVWRILQTTPTLPNNLKNWEVFAAHTTHLGLYALMIILPISGYLDSVAGGYKTQFFGLDVPRLVEKDKVLAEAALIVHVYASYLLYFLLILHVGAALKHHFILRDNVLRRMLP